MPNKEIPSEFFTNNRKKLASFLEDKSLCLLFSNDKMPRTGDQYFPFRQNANSLLERICNPLNS
jgi:Xaa-Pro aminopeptidase